MKKKDLPGWNGWVDGAYVEQKLQITTRTLQRLRYKGRLPYSNINGRCYYRKSDIDALLERNYNGEKGASDEE